MVQIIKGGSEQRQAQERLGYTMGKSLSDSLLNYGAGKAIDSVVNDTSLKDVPMSQKLSKLEEALRPYGEAGQKMLVNRMMVEQQERQEREQQKQKAQMKAQSNVLGKLLNGKEVSEEEMSALSPEQALAWAKHQAAMNKQPKQAISQQPITPEQLQKIKEIRSMPEYASASPSKKYQMLTEGGVSSPLAEAEAKIAAEELKNQPGSVYTKGREKTIEEYTTKALSGLEEADDMQSAMETIEKAIQGDITEPGIMAALKHDPYGQLFFGLTPDEATLTTANKYMLEGTKGIWGSKPTEKEMFTLLNGMLPSVGKTKEANLAGLQVIKRANNLKRIKGEIVSDLTDGGKNYSPNIESLVNKEMKPYADEFKKEAYQLKEVLSQSDKTQNAKAKEGKIKVTAPDGSQWFMTQEQIEAARKKNVIFKPI